MTKQLRYLLLVFIYVAIYVYFLRKHISKKKKDTPTLDFFEKERKM